MNDMRDGDKADFRQKLLLILIGCAALGIVVFAGVWLAAHLGQGRRGAAPERAQSARTLTPLEEGRGASGELALVEIPGLEKRVQDSNQKVVDFLDKRVAPLLEDLGTRGKATQKSLDEAREEIGKRISEVLLEEIRKNERLQDALLKKNAELLEREKEQAGTLARMQAAQGAAMLDTQKAFQASLLKREAQYAADLDARQRAFERDRAADRDAANALLLEFYNQNAQLHDLAKEMRLLYLGTLDDDSLVSQAVGVLKVPTNLIGSALRGSIVKGKGQAAKEKEINERFLKAQEALDALRIKARDAGILRGAEPRAEDAPTS